MRLRYGGAPLASVALTGLEVFSASRLAIGGLLATSTYSNGSNVRIAALLDVGNKEMTQAQIGNMEILAGQKAGLTISPVF